MGSHDTDLNRRIITFNTWKGKTPAMSLASVGFNYTGIGDKVECGSCGIRLYNWQEDETPLTAHKKYSPDCRFLLKHFPHVQAPTTPRIAKVKYPQYADYETRLATFSSWPLKSVAQKPEIMAKSGFFYIGSADRARCHHCGLTLRDWDDDDFPPCVHQQWSENCPFVHNLDIESLVADIEEAVRVDKLREAYKNSDFIDCHQRPKQSEHIVSDSIGDNQIHTQSSDCNEEDGEPGDAGFHTEEDVIGATGGDDVHDHIVVSDAVDSGYSPAVQAVVEMGYSLEMVHKVLDMKRQEGCESLTAMSLLEAILDLED